MVPQPYMAPDATALNANGCKTIPFEVWLLVLTRLKSECIFAKLDYFIVHSSTLTKYKVSKNKAIIGKLGCKLFVTKVGPLQILEPSCFKKLQKKSPNQETGLRNRGCLTFLNVTKLILND